MNLRFNKTQSRNYIKTLKKFKPYKLAVVLKDGSIITGGFTVLPAGDNKKTYTGKVTLKIELPSCHT